MATRRAAVAFPKRGDVYVVRFDPTEGGEISKTRPAVIIQNDVGNRFSDLTIAAPITSKYDANLYPAVPHAPPRTGVTHAHPARNHNVAATSRPVSIHHFST